MGPVVAKAKKSKLMLNADSPDSPIPLGEDSTDNDAVFSVISLSDDDSNDSAREDEPIASTSKSIDSRPNSVSSDDDRLPRLTKIPQWSEAVQNSGQKRLLAQICRARKAQLIKLNEKYAMLLSKGEKKNSQIDELKAELEKLRRDSAVKDEKIKLYKRILILEPSSSVDTNTVAIQTDEFVFYNYYGEYRSTVTFPPLKTTQSFSEHRNDRNANGQED